jgi:hypothetical protein
MRVRDVEPGDAAAIAEEHVASWRLRGLIPLRGLPVTLWTLDANERARRFYAMADWPDGSRTARLEPSALPAPRDRRM